MSDQCFEDIAQNCDECYEVTASDCLDITIQAGLTPAIVYWLWCVAPDGNYYKEQVTIAGDGSFTIDVGSSTYPTGLFNKYAGKFEFLLSTSETNATYEAFTISATSYTCVLVNWTVNCCDNTFVPPTACESFIDSLSSDDLDCVQTNICDVTSLIFAFDPGENSTTVVAIADMAGQYNTESLTNVTSVIYYVNGSPVTLPFIIATSDVIQVDIVQTDPAQASVVEITQ